MSFNSVLLNMIPNHILANCNADRVMEETVSSPLLDIDGDGVIDVVKKTTYILDSSNENRSTHSLHLSGGSQTFYRCFGPCETVVQEDGAFMFRFSADSAIRGHKLASGASISYTLGGLEFIGQFDSFKAVFADISEEPSLFIVLKCGIEIPLEGDWQVQVSEKH